MSDVIYAIVREDETSTLRKITEYPSRSRAISDSELCKFHDYAIDLYNAYCSCLPFVQRQNNTSIPNRSLREDAVRFEDSLAELKQKYKNKLIAYSHRHGGWTTFEWQFNEDIKFVINTNFGYGSNSYFEQSIFYKELKLAPYSKLVKYRFANFTSITSHTYSYEFIYSEWSKVMSDALDFYNAIVERKDNYIFHWLTKHLEKMTSELERYITATYCYFDNIIWENNWGTRTYRTSSERVEGNDFWIAKSNKISEALLFIDNIKNLPIQVDPSKFINRIQQINEKFLPKLESKIETLISEANDLQIRVDEISNEMPLSLYIRLYDKYYYKKAWYISSNKFSMIRFLMRILRRKSNMPISEIKKQLAILETQKKTWEEFKSKLSSTKAIINDLSKDRDKIVKFFTPDKDTNE